MKRFRPRLTVRALILLVAAVALGLFAWTEFRDGPPPRFVLRGIPARIARLRPGMTYREAHAILGLDRPWWQGGTSARPGSGESGGHRISESYHLRGPRMVIGQVIVEGTATGPVSYRVTPAVVGLQFSTPAGWSLFSNLGTRDPGIKLVAASFYVDGDQVAEMPTGP